MRRLLPAMLVVAFILTACVVTPGRHGRVVIAPPLPSVVIFDSEPYYYQSGYHYHYQNNGWYYSQSRSGPWAELPRDRYPREVRYKNRDNRGNDDRGDDRRNGRDRDRDDDRGRDRRDR